VFRAEALHRELRKARPNKDESCCRWELVVTNFRQGTSQTVINKQMFDECSNCFNLNRMYDNSFRKEIKNEQWLRYCQLSCTLTSFDPALFPDTCTDEGPSFETLNLIVSLGTEWGELFLLDHIYYPAVSLSLRATVGQYLSMQEDDNADETLNTKLEVYKLKGKSFSSFTTTHLWWVFATT
jgi:hypothetical protein